MDQPAVHARMLVVDDNVDAAQSLALLLRLIGHDVVAVDSGPAAIAAAEQATFDVVFLDLGMPTMDGYRVAERLQQLDGTRHAHYIAVTGWGQAEHRQRSKSAGFQYHLLKPTDLKSLREILQQILH